MCALAGRDRVSHGMREEGERGELETALLPAPVIDDGEGITLQWA